MGLRRQKIPALLAALALPLFCSVPAFADRTDTVSSTASVELPPSRISHDLPTLAAGRTSTPPPSRLGRSPLDRTQKMVRTALSMRGARYRFGGTGRRGFDCSGFMKYLYGKVKGVAIPRTAAQQFHSGKRVARADLKPGDLLFFRSRGMRVGHVGMYVGNDKMVHAANPRRGVTVDRLFSGYWGRRLVGIRRPAG